jgi:hypothetical protein
MSNFETFFQTHNALDYCISTEDYMGTFTRHFNSYYI